jgi:hypothetical protein
VIPTHPTNPSPPLVLDAGPSRGHDASPVRQREKDVLTLTPISSSESLLPDHDARGGVGGGTHGDIAVPELARVVPTPAPHG